MGAQPDPAAADSNAPPGRGGAPRSILVNRGLFACGCGAPGSTSISAPESTSIEKGSARADSMGMVPIRLGMIAEVVKESAVSEFWEKSRIRGP